MNKIVLKVFLSVLILFGFTKPISANCKVLGEKFIVTSTMALGASVGGYLGYKVLNKEIGIILGSLLVRVPTEILVSKFTPKYQDVFHYWMVLEIFSILFIINQNLLSNELT